MTAEQTINKMARVVNRLYDLVQEQAEEIRQIRSAINADMNLSDCRISKAEGAKILGVSTSTMQRYIDEGRLTELGRTRGGGKIWLSRKQVESLKYLQS